MSVIIEIIIKLWNANTCACIYVMTILYEKQALDLVTSFCTSQYLGLPMHVFPICLVGSEIWDLLLKHMVIFTLIEMLEFVYNFPCNCEVFNKFLCNFSLYPDLGLSLDWNQWIQLLKSVTIQFALIPLHQYFVYTRSAYTSITTLYQ